MISYSELDSYILWKGYGTTTIIDKIEEQLNLAGWVTDKKVTKTFYDRGWGKIYKAACYKLNTGTASRGAGTIPFPYEQIYTYSRLNYRGTSSWTFNAGSNWVNSAGNIDSEFLEDKVFTITAYLYSEGSLQVSDTMSSNVNRTTLVPPPVRWAYTTTTNLTNFTITANQTFLLGCTGTAYYYQYGYVSDINIINDEDCDNLGDRSYELYVHSTTSEGEVLYLSIEYDYFNHILKFYPNTGFDDLSPVDNQPGVIQSDDSDAREYYYFKLSNFYHPTTPTNLYMTCDSDHFYINLTGEGFNWSFHGWQHFYFGQCKKFFNYAGGFVTTGSYFNRYTVSTDTTTTATSDYYVYYEGSWYGETIAASVSNRQGYIDLITPPTYSTALTNKWSNEIYLTQQVAGINTNTITDDATYVPIGTIHNFYKHYGSTNNLITDLKINGDTYWSIPINSTERRAVKAVEAE